MAAPYYDANRAVQFPADSTGREQGGITRDDPFVGERPTSIEPRPPARLDHGLARVEVLRTQPGEVRKRDAREPVHARPFDLDVDDPHRVAPPRMTRVKRCPKRRID